MLDHPDLAPHVVAGRRMHGGFRPDGIYQPPRALVREAALGAWQTALVERGGAPLDADASLLGGLRLPTVEQSRVLLRHGLGETFWNSLTITGKIEARGRLLADVDVPGAAAAHRGRHLRDGDRPPRQGLAEGARVRRGWRGQASVRTTRCGSRRATSRSVRVPTPMSIRPTTSPGRRWASGSCPRCRRRSRDCSSLLMNLLVIEFRAEIGFAATQDDPAHARPVRRPAAPQAEEAAEIVDRIRADEDIHVRSLRLYLGECAAVTFRTVDGGTVPGRELIDRFWDGLVHWATVEQPALVAAQQRERAARTGDARTPTARAIWARVRGRRLRSGVSPTTGSSMRDRQVVARDHHLLRRRAAQDVAHVARRPSPSCPTSPPARSLRNQRCSSTWWYSSAGSSLSTRSWGMAAIVGSNRSSSQRVAAIASVIRFPVRCSMTAP